MATKRIKMNTVYLTKFGTEFTPVRHIPGKLKSFRNVNPWANPIQREESRYADKDGKHIKKSNLLKPKDDRVH
ncbi:hypothetical protein Molly5_150 [Maribacter phage Molly_5]|uniref:Uncharacterized protein n=1 Tax=Maribacter phage Molly_1 TaxID=2745685 RepID=A0A8E4XXX7_9CAUD|nr:hypothetical protein M1M29_gp149 [Maribacter phage Molly_1]QQO97643.1 hypothetical protein Molly2_149 [Maribacter phage Molly_2]QQO97843.1 hypothetical protein Molly3_149 [Maribacter phage Molly_3]QQO98045.1 hypothetical protein Molly4_150 [Maribacter phage Molly_4]QQO98245.1 hypothetical protein Molly5_150 [Maribacter phage Molly_5]QQO97443.1 hypothetical protein Molly1_149 [Maribacter phage Molly_1]